MDKGKKGKNKMELKTKEMLLNIGKPRLANMNSIYAFTKEDIKGLRQRDEEMLNDYDNWRNHENRQLLISIVNEWCETFRCYSLHY